ncbi:MAG: recombinase family protein [Archangium sp.]|nr:recombinase family protein [Archangium sp.]MDP3576306.1 recombinase family protein [Archangium sp.]
MSDESTVVIYARVSTDKQDARSVDDQERRCRDFAQRNRLNVVRVFSDVAISGSHTDRPGLQRLLAEAKLGAFAHVLVDDLSRLSRNDIDFNQLVFSALSSRGIGVTDVASGGSSTDGRSHQHFKFNALLNSFQLDQIRRNTHRGLEGRHRHGFSTGGRVFGYTTKPEAQPQDPQRIRKEIIVDKTQAKIVVRIFDMYGRLNHGLREIASTLNVEQVSAPGDGRGNKRHGPGWSPSTVRAILKNRRYLGELTWNARKHVREEGRKSRRALKNKSGDVIVLQRPDLAIVNAEAWARVEQRFERNTSTGAGRGRPIGSGRKEWHLLGGILRCAACGYAFGMTGSRWKNGVRYQTLGCLRARVRGPESCENRRTVAELKLNKIVVRQLRGLLSDPDLLSEVAAGYQARVRELRRRPSHEVLEQLARDLSDAEAEIRNLTNALGKSAWSEALADALRAAEGRRTKARNALDLETRRQQPAPSSDLDTPEAAKGLIDRVLSLIDRDPKSANVLLRKHLGTIVMTPDMKNPRGGFSASGAFTFGVAEKDGCGGRI